MKIGGVSINNGICLNPVPPCVITMAVIKGEIVLNRFTAVIAELFSHDVASLSLLRKK